MLPEFPSKPVDVGAPVAESAAHLFHIVQRVLGTQDNTRITLPNLGNITILPKSREYHADVEDMREFSIAPVTNYAIKTLDSPDLTSISQQGKDVRDLLWQLAFYTHENSLIESCSENDVIQFSHWPNLTRLPVTPNTARICALLTRHPTSITLVRRILGIDKNEVNRVISAAYSSGIVKTISRGPSLASVEPALAETKPEQTQKAGLWNSLFTKISSL